MYKIIEFIPILTTIFAAFFSIEIFKHYKIRLTKYLKWWTIGIITFGLGTLAESINALFGWNEINLKYWYITGALLGGFPLAQGSVHLLLNKKFAKFTSWLFTIIIIIASILIISTPLAIPDSFDFKLTGSVFQWQWVRYFSPFINTYALVFLVGGAIYSALIYYHKGQKEAPFKGNILIAIGGLLPGIGGSFTRMGYVEVLYITELIGLVMMYLGYRIIKLDRKNK